jgi:RHS repeat-associated protein
MTVYSIADTTWVETSITWNNKPPRGGALSSTTVTGNTFVYYEFDVSSYVIAEKAAGRNLVSFALHNPAESSQAIWMHSRETTSSSPPQLVITLNEAPTVALTSPANGATFTAPATIPLAATAADADGTIAKVEFFHGGTNLIATVTSAPYTFNWTNVAAASYTLTARATDNLGAVTTSAPVNITVNAGVAQLFFIHTDHLNTPRVITNNAGQAVWRWDQTDPFGGNVPDENPSGLGTFTCNLRLPGQYFDRELNTHYNYFRDYDPGIGRYIQSDPIGLGGGLNTYLYAFADPLKYVDPRGLESCFVRGDCYGQADANYKGCTAQVNPGIVCVAVFARCIVAARSPVLFRLCLISSAASCSAYQFACLNQLFSDQKLCDLGIPIDGYAFGDNYGMGPDCKCYSRPRFRAQQGS